MVTAMDCQELLERLVIRLDSENGTSVHVDKSSNNVAGEVQELNGKIDGDDVKATEN